MRRLPLCALLAATLFACEPDVARYPGEAWPDRRPPLPRPVGGAPLALISDNGSDTLSLVDLAGPHTMARIPIGLDPIENDGPHHLAVDAAGGAVFTAFAYPPPVMSAGPHGNHGASQVPGVLVRLGLEDLRLQLRASTDVNPGDVRLTPDGSRVLVTHFDLARAMQLASPGNEDARRSSLIVYDAATLARLGSVPVGLAAHGLTISPDSRTAFVTCYASDELAVVRIDDPALPVTRVPVGPGAGSGASLRYGPYAALLSGDGGSVYVSTVESREVRVYDVAAGAFDPARVAPVRGAAFFPALGPDGATLLVPVQSPDGLFVLDAQTLEVRKARSFTRSDCQRPHEIARAPDGRYVLVCEGDRQSPGTLIAVDPTTLDILGRTELGVYPDAIAFIPAGAP
jgi:DNA-binding beta-propeller fold protein YncE